MLVPMRRVLIMLIIMRGLLIGLRGTATAAGAVIVPGRILGMGMVVLLRARVLRLRAGIGASGGRLLRRLVVLMIRANTRGPGYALPAARPMRPTMPAVTRLPTAFIRARAMRTLRCTAPTNATAEPG
jgi:hypothetical protein